MSAGRAHPPGCVLSSDRAISLAPGRDRITITVTNRSDHTVRVSSHYPFWQTNARLEFDRERAYGFRLDIPAGTSVRWRPGERREVRLVSSLVSMARKRLAEDRP